jgi:phosphatidylserine decarboxylase
VEIRKPGAVWGRYSALVAHAAGAKLPIRLREPAYRVFARATGANLAEAELGLREYSSLGELFARRLRPGVRPIDPAAHALIAPCDGVVAASGIAEDGVLVQAKGHTYTLEELVVDRERATALRGGAYATIYLSPRDYHRVHAPMDAQLLGYDYVPGELWPVNPRVAARRSRLFTRNERVVIWFDAPRIGTFAVVMIGASGVGNIRVFVPGTGTAAALVDSASWRGGGELRRVELVGTRVARGDELGAFRLGSTVVLVMPPGAVRELGCREGQAVRFGQSLGELA